MLIKPRNRGRLNLFSFRNADSKRLIETTLRHPWEWLRKQLFSLSPEEATFKRRGFYASVAEIQEHLETIGCTFVEGYQAVINDENPEIFLGKLKASEAELAGFAFEGAAMALFLLDQLTPWRGDRFLEFVGGPGNPYIYMSYVGAGWGLARLQWRLKPYLHQLSCGASVGQFPDPLLGWLAIDGYGFHQGYFQGRKYIETLAFPSELSAWSYALKVFDQGLGRSLWFVQGADVARIAQKIQQFPPYRRADLWSGVGLACTYAGGVDRASIEQLRRLAAAYLPQIAQGAAFAAKTRIRAGNMTENTEMCCQVLCGMSAEPAATITDLSLIGLSSQATTPAYEIWRQRIQNHFAIT
ncbi:DUF1702 family protein [Gloeothece verrucosa]|uniref:DUF1702 family protein n=1 Tax=Gloeothece verrucosa (strain PCC 7822) TaxID=497965 RepID=E0U572_GLOV7|nr:DUF1702 family protein [Gloeothece verrucosa]ADN12351.1 protein of unknown function DUF1702 [Gloeothece verrucosa PCC 7822]